MGTELRRKTLNGTAAGLPDDVEEVRCNSKFEPRHIDLGLAAIAEFGSASKAVAHLRAMGIVVNRRQLSYWKTKYPRRFAALAQRYSSRNDRELQANFRELVMASQEVGSMAVALERERVASGQVKDAAASARNMATVAGISTDKLGDLEGRPTVVVHEHRDVADIIRSINERAPGLVVEGHAEEIEEESDAE